ncbi:hypothetical protein SAMN05660297_01492 [Natronincola peptidivorans]|uniref:Uncharacterized protein n=1 Tax=Natronincola peptidivorans TaxID=426128 RepID=A0A1I0BZF7_9FIRM|nr:hypothetical protein SAMN05660297_01492 [Natronincola peptidivorans]
MRKTKAEKPRQ